MSDTKNDFDKAISALVYDSNYKNVIQEMVKNGFDINSCTENGSTVLSEYLKLAMGFYWRQEGGILSPSESGIVEKKIKEVTVFLKSLGAKEETEQAKLIKFDIQNRNEKIKQDIDNAERLAYLTTLPPKKEFNSLQEAIKYENMPALKDFISQGENINACDSDGNTILAQYMKKLEDQVTAQMTGNYYLALPFREAQHVNRVITMLEEVGALMETDESKKIKEQKKIDEELAKAKQKLSDKAKKTSPAPQSQKSNLFKKIKHLFSKDFIDR